MNNSYFYLDVAFKRGKVITLNSNNAIAEAVGIKGNKIVFVGSDQEIDQLISEHTQVVDLAGRSLLPGFNDTHFHLVLNGLRGPE